MRVWNCIEHGSTIYAFIWRRWENWKSFVCSTKIGHICQVWRVFTKVINCSQQPLLPPPPQVTQNIQTYIWFHKVCLIRSRGPNFQSFTTIRTDILLDIFSMRAAKSKWPTTSHFVACELYLELTGVAIAEEASITLVLRFNATRFAGLSAEIESTVAKQQEFSETKCLPPPFPWSLNGIMETVFAPYGIAPVACASKRYTSPSNRAVSVIPMPLFNFSWSFRDSPNSSRLNGTRISYSVFEIGAKMERTRHFSTCFTFTRCATYEKHENKTNAKELLLTICQQ